MTYGSENPNKVQVERLKAQVARLERDLAGAFDALEQAGTDSRRRRDVQSRWAEDVRRMSGVLMKVVADEDLPEHLRDEAADAIGGALEDRSE